MERTVEQVQINGSVASVIYTNEENGYTVLRLETDDGEEITVTGCLPFAAPGEQLTVTGSWTQHASYGRQFKADYADRTLPTGVDAIYTYLAGRTIRGIGPATAALIVNKFGENSLDVLENAPEKLATIRGISLSKAKEISQSYRRQAGIRRLLELLARYGLKPGYAMRLYRFYGDAAAEILRENPYILSSEHIGATFAEADTLAVALGFESDAPQRVNAATIFELTHNLNNGHSFIPAEKLVAATAQLIGVEAETVEEGLEVLKDSGDIVEEEIAGVQGCYLRGLYEAETYTAARLRAMAAGQVQLPMNTERIVVQVEEELGIRYDGAQAQALEKAAAHQLMVVTGGPGTGKTTVVRGLLGLYDRAGWRVILAAPTGRAAKRMTELSGREAYTIHRLLGAAFAEDGESVVFRKDEKDPLNCDVVILDECSMVDILLMQALLRAMRPDCALILVGDADQLPAVGPGNVFSDIIRSGVVETVRLTEIFRQLRTSRILSNAHSINRGEHPNLTENKGDFFFLRRRDYGAIPGTVAQLCQERLPKNMGIPVQDIQVISPTRLYEAGTRNLNLCLQQTLNPPSPEKPEMKYGETVFRLGDKVMQIKNNYDILWQTVDKQVTGNGIFNGDIGQIVAVDTAAEVLTVNFDGRLTQYGLEMLSELEHAFAITVHKAQGSEYPAVILAVGKTPKSLLTRRLLYTAVSRAKSLLILVGDETAVNYMIDNHKRAGRYSGLRARLCAQED